MPPDNIYSLILKVLCLCTSTNYEKYATDPSLQALTLVSIPEIKVFTRWSLKRLCDYLLHSSLTGRMFLSYWFSTSAVPCTFVIFSMSCDSEEQNCFNFSSTTLQLSLVTKIINKWGKNESIEEVVCIIGFI